MASAAQVPEEVLVWLHNSLSREYHDLPRTYTDVTRTLSSYRTLSPRTEVYTFEHGTSALLLLLQGTLPVSFRGTTYRFPIALWIPHIYPRESPIVYVTPSKDLLVRPGQHVSVEGRIFHPYLAGWTENWERANLVEFLAILQDVFAKEPPVIARQPHQHAYSQRQNSTNGQPPRPAPPPMQGRDARYFVDPSSAQARSSESSTPPPPPPKPPEVGRRPKAQERERVPSAANTEQEAPPLPPKPGRRGGQPSYSNAYGDIVDPVRGSQGQSVSLPHRPLKERPPPPLPLDSAQQYQDPRLAGIRQAPAQYPPHQPQYIQQPPPPQIYPRFPKYAPPSQPTAQSLRQTTPQQAEQHPQPPKPKQPLPDLLSLDLPTQIPQQPTTSPSTHQAAPPSPPPIPPNPEKDANLHSISHHLVTHLHQLLSQNAAALPALHSQQHALLNAQHAMQSEMSQLATLNNMLTSNEEILRESMQRAERIMEDVKGRNVPGVDEVLVAPTVVGEQLYGLVAEERGIVEVRGLLGRGLDRGRVGGDVFVRQTRSLAREEFLTKALIKKIARGMGLAMTEGRLS